MHPHPLGIWTFGQQILDQQWKFTQCTTSWTLRPWTARMPSARRAREGWKRGDEGRVLVTQRMQLRYRDRILGKIICKSVQWFGWWITLMSTGDNFPIKLWPRLRVDHWYFLKVLLRHSWCLVSMHRNRSESICSRYAAMLVCTFYCLGCVERLGKTSFNQMNPHAARIQKYSEMNNLNEVVYFRVFKHN